MKDSSATIIVNTEKHRGEYAMFDLHSLDEEGAVLRGPLLMEVGESLRLRLNRKGEDVEVRAKVHSVSQQEEQMTVRFVELSSKAKALLAKK